MADAIVYAPAQAQRLHEHVVQQVVRQIVGGALPPGSALPTEPDLAQQFGVSRTVVREAVRVLAAKGLVAVRQGSGMRVQPDDRWDHLDSLVVFEQVRAGRDDSFINEMIEMRRLVERELAALAAQRRTPADLECLARIVAGMEAALDDPPAYARLDNDFHQTVLATARNRLLREALRPIGGVLRAALDIASQRPQVAERSLPSHREIHAAIAAGDSVAARAAMGRHIAQFEQDIRAALELGGGAFG